MRPETLITYRENQWHGGAVYVEDEFPNLNFAKDGEVYDLEGTKAIAIGGAYSVDKWYRLQRDLHWFPDEQPSNEIKARVEKKLDALDWQIDAVLTHTCPYGYIPREAFMSCVDQSTVDNSTELWLDTIEKKLNYNAWYCGHWHIEKRIDIVTLRKAAGLSVHDLQMVFGFNSPQAIYKWQNGAALPTVDNLIVLAALFNVLIDDILVTTQT